MSQAMCYLVHENEEMVGDNTCEECSKPICNEHSRTYLDINDQSLNLCPTCYEIRLKKERGDLSGGKPIISNLLPIIGFVVVVAILMLISSNSLS